MRRFFKIIRVVLAASALFVQSALAQGILQPVNLRCAHRVNPLGIGDVNPLLSWQVQSATNGIATRGQIQTAFQIQVGSSASAADLWDSGKVVSAETVDIPYAGAALSSGQQCFWQVRVYDGAGKVSSWSAPAQWSMGLLSSNDWAGQWIGYDAAYTSGLQAPNNSVFNTTSLSWFTCQSTTPGVNWCAMRKWFTLPADDVVTNAVFALYADDVCGVFVNGQAMTNLAVHWDATALINVTDSLETGSNLLALAVTNFDQGESPSVIGQLILQLDNGDTTNIPVDGTWTSTELPAAGWTQPGFNNSSWPSASGIQTPGATPALNDIQRVPAAYLRKNFVVQQPVTRATAYVTALGAYELHLNGQKVGNDVLTPGWSQFTKRVYYQTYDVTSLVQTGSNTVGAILGDGWYASVLAVKGARCNYGGTPRLLAQVVLQFADGTTQTVATDSTWNARYGPVLYGDLLIGSEYDARREMPGWDNTNFDASSWSPVVSSSSSASWKDVTAIVSSLVTNNQLNFVAENSNLGGDPAPGVHKTLQITFQIGNGTPLTQQFGENTIVTIGNSNETLMIISAYYGNAANSTTGPSALVQAAVTEPSRCLETRSAVNLTQPNPGCYTFDFGQNMVGWVHLTVNGKPGDRIAVRHGEMLNPDGTLYTANLRGATAADFYDVATNGVTVFEPRFTFHGFRYIEIRGLSSPPTLNSVTGMVVHSDITPSGSFACSSPLVNQLYSNLVWSQKGNYFEVPTDCPQRDERMGWTGDTEFFIPTATYNYDIESFFRRHLVTLCEDSQESDGSYADVAPDLGYGSDAAGWEDAGWICPYTIYRAYGDTNAIADHYASMQTFGQYLASHANNYVIYGLDDFGDWLNLGGDASFKVIDTAFYASYASAMSEMATAIGKTQDASNYATLRTNIANQYATFFNADGTFADGSSQTGYALAFTLNLVPQNLRAAASTQFANSLAAFNNHLATGFIGTPRLLPALHAANQDALAYQVLLQQTYPSWLYQVTLGSTTMWERWDGWTPQNGFEDSGMNSFNHYAFGSVGQFLYADVGGISAASPGYRNIMIQPAIGNGLTWANTSYDSIRGLISTSWTNNSNAFSLQTVIPPNTTAQIYIPTGSPTNVTENGVPAASSPGVSYIGFSNNYAIYAVGSGSYAWSSVLPLPPVAPPPPSFTETNHVYNTNGVFPLLPPGDLLTNQATSVAMNTLTAGSENHSPTSVLYDGHVGAPGTTNGTYEISGGAITFYLGPGLNDGGYTITNLVTYSAWRDDGRENANYKLSYSSDGVTFWPLVTVAYNPSSYPTYDSTGGTTTSLAVTNLTGVQYLKWDFTVTQQNDGVGYTELAAFGQSTIMPGPVGLTAANLQAGGFVMNLSGLATGQNYILQSTTNLPAQRWITETNFIANQISLSLTNAIGSSPQKFYRVVTGN